MRFLGTLIGYLCTAALITQALGLGYLWGTNRLDDERMFRLVALLHDVDIDRIQSESEAETAGEVPDEEPSPEDVEWQRQVLARNHELKAESLKRNKLIFDASYNRLVTDRKRFDEIASKLESQLKQDGELASKKNLDQVVHILELQKPDQAKDELMQILGEDNGVEDAIKIINKMSQAKLKKIVQQFQSPDEQEKLHTILGMMLQGGQQKEIFESALEELGKLRSQ
ncbi:MAG: hypothetical protein KDA37_10060 [Planctomycetales bacterium]|nr:hypothetical protein [Planctomycetales bacterium]